MTKNRERKRKNRQMPPTGPAANPAEQTELAADNVEQEDVLWGVMPCKVSKALCNIVDHYMPDEKRDYEASKEKSSVTHIFLDLDLVDAWLRYIAGT
jgi:hypothetical protein